MSAAAMTQARGGLNPVRRALYGGLLRQMQYIDSHPETKFQCTLPDSVRGALRLGGLYNPVLYPSSYTDALRDAVRLGAIADTSQGFELLRHLASFVTKHKKLHPLSLSGAVEKGPLDPAEKLKRQSEGNWAEALTVPIAPSLLKIGADRSSAAHAQEAAEAGASQHDSAPTDIAPKPATEVLEAGTLLLAHPILNEHAMSSQVLLFLHKDTTTMRLLVLNSPQAGTVDPHNPFFPPSLRGQPFTLAGLRTHFSEPAVPLVNILHPYPELPHATVLRGAVQSEERDLCWSTHDDFPYIDNLVKTGRAQPSDFKIFQGQHDAHRFVMDRHIPEGIWIPTATTSKVILEAQHDTIRRSPRSVWEKVMRLMGGDYAYAAEAKETVPPNFANARA